MPKSAVPENDTPMAMIKEAQTVDEDAFCHMDAFFFHSYRSFPVGHTGLRQLVRRCPAPAVPRKKAEGKTAGEKNDITAVLHPAAFARKRGKPTVAGFPLQESVGSFVWGVGRHSPKSHPKAAPDMPNTKHSVNNNAYCMTKRCFLSRQNRRPKAAVGDRNMIHRGRVRRSAFCSRAIRGQISTPQQKLLTP